MYCGMLAHFPGSDLPTMHSNLLLWKLAYAIFSAMWNAEIQYLILTSSSAHDSFWHSLWITVLSLIKPFKSTTYICAVVFSVLMFSYKWNCLSKKPFFSFQTLKLWTSFLLKPHLTIVYQSDLLLCLCFFVVYFVVTSQNVKASVQAGLYSFGLSIMLNKPFRIRLSAWYACIKSEMTIAFLTAESMFVPETKSHISAETLQPLSSIYRRILWASIA